jgi:2-dehydro-3-deoxygluconokinase
VDTSLTLWTESGRVGVYFIEFGAPPRAHNVTYDRAHSAVSQLTPDLFDWTHLDQARHLHLTGITAALSESCAETVLHAAQQARRRGLSVSIDVNYRSKLWSPEQARRTLSGILPSADILICALADAAEVFGLTGSAEQTARAFQRDYGIPQVVLTMGAEGAVARAGEQEYRCAGIPATEVDRVGAGDAFDAGVLHGFLDGDLEKGLRYGTAMASLKHTIPGDLLIATREEIEAVMSGGPRGIQR